MTFDNRFETAFAGGLTDIKFFVRRGTTASVDDLKKDAVAFQTAIDSGNVKKVDSVD